MQKQSLREFLEAEIYNLLCIDLVDPGYTTQVLAEQFTERLLTLINTITPLNTLAKEINEINTGNGWNVVTPEQWEDPYKVPAILALIHSEVSEALEGFRRNDRENFAEELADVTIRILDCTGGLGIDLDTEIANKLEKNKGRGYRHGGKRL